MADAQHRFLTNRRILVAPNRHIELAFGIDAPQAIETSLVEVDETSGYINAVIELMLAADVVVVVFAVLCRVLAQLGDEGLGVALDNLVGIDEVKVDIT